ncbi:hypothetical protein MATL_G00252020 [Megalops atlanticus]|uniref:C-type lectin domain-containing protein n=1 Tax=Megalops atlanticus TaxID=7932 RepID=A0A9D3P9B0_MEGAT|nr:hypothetical protein MATL_G00252020 [Megalops atlanticus]
MKLDFFVISLFPGLCTLCSCLSRQYHFVNITMNWTEAQSYCRQNYTDLATIDSTEEVKALTEAVGSGYDGKAWIGLQRAGSDGWQWSLTDRGFYSEGEAEFRDWENGQPNNRVGTEDCVAVERNGKWHDFSCQDNIFFICYDRQNVSQRYFLIEQEKTWTEAQRYCREKHTDLVSVRNQAENQEVLSTIQTSAWVWIGLFNDPWKWSDQSSSSFRYWNTGEPNNNGGREECVEMWFGHSGRWNDEYCENKRAFICYQGESVPPV